MPMPLGEKRESHQVGTYQYGQKATPTKVGLTLPIGRRKSLSVPWNLDWKLRWNFNLYNYLGIGWHQYDLLASCFTLFVFVCWRKMPLMYTLGR